MRWSHGRLFEGVVGGSDEEREQAIGANINRSRSECCLSSIRIHLPHPQLHFPSLSPCPFVHEGGSHSSIYVPLAHFALQRCKLTSGAYRDVR